MTPAARIAATIELLAAIESAPAKPADAIANDYFRNRRFIGGGDRRSVSDRAWGVLRARRRLGWWITRAQGEPTPRLLVATDMLLGGMAVDAVERQFGAGKFAPPPLNAEELAVLRPLAGHTLDHPKMPEAVRLEIPDWLLPLLHARFGAELAVEMAAMAEPAPLDLRVNLLKGTREAAQVALAAEGIAATPSPLSPWGLRVPGRKPVTAGAAFQEGLVEIQDEGSQLVAGIVDVRPGMRVCDWCAGAGGKTLAMAMTMDNRGHIAACDVSAMRLEGAVRRLRRAGVHNVERHVTAAGDKWAKRRAEGFDRVLVDAPCTGTGTWRRNPDARLRLEERDLAELQEKQAAILRDAARLVRKGGRLVYATCSLLAEENEAQVQRFLDAHPDFTVLPPARAWAGLPAALAGLEPFLTLTPRKHGTDGFFAAVLERTAC
jgi:16S rRNA (cytosine967-C5)-methyltransferase